VITLLGIERLFI